MVELRDKALSHLIGGHTSGSHWTKQVVAHWATPLDGVSCQAVTSGRAPVPTSGEQGSKNHQATLGGQSPDPSNKDLDLMTIGLSQAARLHVPPSGK